MGDRHLLSPAQRFLLSPAAVKLENDSRLLSLESPRLLQRGDYDPRTKYINVDPVFRLYDAAPLQVTAGSSCASLSSWKTLMYPKA